MAEYTFGQNILRYIQNQDELNLRAKQMQTEEERYKIEQSFNERQAQLEGARWNANYMFNVEKEQANRDNDFNKDNTILDALPEYIRNQIPTEAYKYKGENIYVPNEVVTNLEQSSQRALDLEKEKNDQEQLKITNENAKRQLEIESGKLAEQIRMNNFNMGKGNKGNFNSAISPKLYTENFSKANANLIGLKNVMQTDDYTDKTKSISKTYEDYKVKGMEAITNALSNVGITSATLFGDTGQTVFDYIRAGGNLNDQQKAAFQDKINSTKRGSREEATAKREFLNASINSISHILLSEQLQALKLWNEIGTR